MCQAIPGLRCPTHARKTLNIATDKAKEAYNIMQNTATGTSTDNPRLVKAMQHYQRRMKIAEKAYHEYELTPESMEALKSKIADIKTHLMNPLMPASGDDSEYTTENLNALEVKYNSLQLERSQRMQQYDRKNRTVNGRKPSAYGTQKGILELKNKHKKAFDNWTKAIANGASDEETKTLSRNVLRAQKAYQHAVATYTHRRKGIIR